MIKIPSAIRRSPATALSDATTQRDATAARLAVLEQQRAAAIDNDGDVSGVLQIDRETMECRAKLAVLADRIALAEAALSEKEAERHAKAYSAAVEKIAGRALALNGAVTEFADAIGTVVAKLEMLATAQRSVLHDWPDVVGRPLLSQIGLQNAEATLAECFGVFDRNKFGRWPDWSLQRRVEHARTVAAQFKADEIRGYDEMVSGLRAAPAKTDEVAA